MKTKELKIAKIGNSRGVRIPAETLQRYAFTDVAVMVEGVDGILLRPKRETIGKLSWIETAEAMAAAAEDWSDWESATADGLTDLPWETASVVADKLGAYGKASRKKPQGKS